MDKDRKEGPKLSRREFLKITCVSLASAFTGCIVEPQAGPVADTPAIKINNQETNGTYVAVESAPNDSPESQWLVVKCLNDGDPNTVEARVSIEPGVNPRIPVFFMDELPETGDCSAIIYKDKSPLGKYGKEDQAVKGPVFFKLSVTN